MGNQNYCFMVIAGSLFFSSQSPNSHCTFFFKFISWRIAQIAIHQLSDPGNTKCCPWKVFETNHPQTLQLLSRIGPGRPEARLSQHHIGPKMKFRHFSNFCRKKFPGLIKRVPAIIEWTWRSCHTIFTNYNPKNFIKMCRSLFVKPENLKNDRISFVGQCNVETISPPGF